MPSTTLMTVDFLDTVSGTLTLEAVPLHHTCGAAALAGANHVDPINTIKETDGQHLANLKPLGLTTKLPHKPLRLTVSLGEHVDAGLTPPLRTLAIEDGHLPTARTADKPARAVAKTNLDSLIAIPFQRPQKKHRTWPSFDYRDRNHRSVRIEDLRHPDLAA